MARDTWDERLDHFGSDFEPWLMRESKARTDLFEDSLDNLMTSSITRPSCLLIQSDKLAADFFHEYRAPDQLDDISTLSPAQTAD